MVLKKIESALIIGMGLIGSSLSRALYKYHLVSSIYGIDKDPNVIKKCKELNIVVNIENDIKKFKHQFDLIIISSPLSTYKEIFSYLNKFVNQPTLLTDVGSTK